MILLELQAKDSDADPNHLYQMLCEDGEFTRMFEECDAHELNLFLQDKLMELVPKSVRKYLRGQGLKGSVEVGDKIRLTDSTMSEVGESKHAAISLSEILDDDQKNVHKHSQNPLLAMH